MLFESDILADFSYFIIFAQNLQNNNSINTVVTIFMEIADITKTRNEIHVNLANRHLTMALSLLQKLVGESGLWILDDELKRINTAYGFMLQYLSNGVLDPQRNAILSQLIDDTYTLTDKASISLLDTRSSHIFYVRHKASKTTSLQSLIEEYNVERNKLNLINSVEESSRDTAAARSITVQCERLESDIFNQVWSTFPTPASDVDLMTGLMGNETIPAHLKSLIISALLLGLTTFYDEPKLALLLRCYATGGGNDDLKLRALINAVIATFLHRKRLACSEFIKKELSKLEEVPSFKQDLRLIFTRLIHSRNTDNISRKMREGLMPEINKMSPDLFNKIKGKTPGTIDISEIEENPQWQEWLDKSGISRKLEEFNEIQLEGGDVFISTFAKLKSYPFFNTLSNWFLPYHDKSSVVSDAFGSSRSALTSLFKMMPILCDSDKYSMLLSMASAPQAQRDMMFQQFDAQREQFEELQSDAGQSVIKMRDIIVNRYIQDLYRFFKLYSRRREFISIFDTDINLMEVESLRCYIGDTETLSILAEFYFKNGFYNDAIKYFNYMLKNHDANPHVYQKIGYAYQALGKYREALKSYSRYELADDTDSWNLKQMAQCYRSLHNHDKAIEYFGRALELSPQSVQLCLNLGHCYLDRADYDNALQQYYKADFMSGAKHRAWRPIAWCCFMLGKNEEALNYYEKIVTEDSPTSQDYLNYGHLRQTMGEMGKAIELYRKSLELENKKIDSFSKLYVADSKYLLAKGITAEDYALVLDAVIS